MSVAMSVATVGAGLFAGAATYLTAVEHPARLACGQELAVKEFGPSYHRAAIMQVPLAAVALLGGMAAWYQGSGTGWLVGGLLLGAVIPFTLVVMMPINRRLLDPQLDSRSPEADELLRRWGWLHAVRTVVSDVVFIGFISMSLGS